MKKAMCLVMLIVLLISLLGCRESDNNGKTSSQSVSTIDLELIPAEAKTMTVSYYKMLNYPEAPEKLVYTATQNQFNDLRSKLEDIEYIELSEKDLLSYSNAAYINAWDIKIDFDKGESLYIYTEGAISRFITDKSSIPIPHSYYVSADLIYGIQKILIPDFEKDYITLTKNDEYKKVDNINPEKIQEVAFYLPTQRKIYEFGDGFIAFNSVWGGDNKYFLRAVKYDVNGNFVWVKNYTEIESAFYQRINFIKMSDGGFAVALDGDIAWHSENSDTSESKRIPDIQHGYLLKCDQDGNKVWGESLEFDGSGQVESLLENQKGEIITVGCCQMNGDEFAKADPTYGVTDIVLMKYDKDGNRTKFRTFGGSDFESFISACYSPKTGLVINGTTQSCDRDITARKEKGTMLYPRDFIATFGDDLNSKWQFVFEGEQEVYSSEIALVQDNIYLAGPQTKDSGNFKKTNVFKFDFEGNLLKSSKIDSNVCILSASQKGEILIANRTSFLQNSEKMQLFKLDQNLKITDKIEDLDGDGYNYSIVQTDDGGFFITHTENVKYLPQPPCMNRSITDMSTVLCKYDKDGNLEYRKTYDKNHNVENIDIVIPLSNGKVIIDK